MNSRMKRVTAILIIMLVVIGSVPGLFAIGEGKAYAAAGFAGGTGTQHDPYQIATADQLNEVRNSTYYGTYFILTDHIDLASYSNWTPIPYYYGNMDGDGYTISNLSISVDTDYAGLIGNVGYSVKLTNMNLVNIDVKGKVYVGGYGLSTLAASAFKTMKADYVVFEQLALIRGVFWSQLL
jgi:hypothetical protein